MIAPNLLETIERLPLEQRLTLLEFISRTARAELADTNASRVRGLLATDQLAPSDEEVQNGYTESLDEKYG